MAGHTNRYGGGRPAVTGQTRSAASLPAAIDDAACTAGHRGADRAREPDLRAVLVLSESVRAGHQREGVVRLAVDLELVLRRTVRQRLRVGLQRASPRGQYRNLGRDAGLDGLGVGVVLAPASAATQLQPANDVGRRGTYWRCVRMVRHGAKASPG